MVKHLFLLQSLFGLLLLAACKSDDSVSEKESDYSAIPACSTPGTVDPSTDPDIEVLRQAIITFRNSLSKELLEASTSCLDDPRFYTWHNTPANNRNRDGIIYGDLDETQLSLFKDLMQKFLSSSGYQKVNEITTLAEAYLHNLNPNLWDPEFYSIDMFGNPETSGSWGFQLDGHHCAVNFLVHGDYVSIVPAFLGSEPVTETWEGVAFDVFAQERDLALALYDGMNGTERAAAVSSGSLVMQVGPAARNGDPDPYRGMYDYSGFATGLKYSDMSATTKENLISLMKEYVYNLNSTYADEWWADVNAGIDETYFVWIDNVASPSKTTQFYYRIYNPYLWVEYNMENPVGPGLPDWNHAHTLTRIPDNPTTDDGGDYGIFARLINQGGPRTLYEHYLTAGHHRSAKPMLDYVVKGLNVETDDHGHSHAEGGA